jgi:hypothetical protein
MKDKWLMNREVLQRKFLFYLFIKKFLFLNFSSDFEEGLVEENVIVTLDDVQTIKVDFNPSIENTMWFA